MMEGLRWIIINDVELLMQILMVRSRMLVGGLRGGSNGMKDIPIVYLEGKFESRCQTAK